MSTESSPPALVVRALGVPIGIPVTGPAADRLRRQWSRALSEQEPVTVVDLGELRPDDEVAHDYAVTSRVTLAALEATAGRRVNLHAGAVADQDGRALVLIGPSGSGKTTAIGLLARRLGYLSDETASVDEALEVHPHPKPLSVIADADAPLRKLSLSPDELDLVHPPASARLHRIVLLHRGEVDEGLVPLPAARAIADIVAQSSSLASLDHPIRRLADVIDACGGVWSLRYREFSRWLDDLVALLDVEAPPPPPRVHHPGRGDVAPVQGSWTRLPWRDAVEYDDELVLMVGDRVHVLAGLGVVLWLALEAPRPADDLVAEVCDLWGEHPDAVGLVSEALGVLAREGLVGPPA